MGSLGMAEAKTSVTARATKRNVLKIVILLEATLNIEVPSFLAVGFSCVLGADLVVNSVASATPGEINDVKGSLIVVAEASLRV